MFRGRRKETADEGNKKWDSPLEELTYLLDELEKIVQKSKDDYITSITPPSPEKNRRSSMMDSLKKFRSRRMGSASEYDNPGETPPTTPAAGSTTQKAAFSETPQSLSAQTPTSVPATPRNPAAMQQVEKTLHCQKTTRLRT